MQDEITQFAASIGAERMTLNISADRTLFSRPNYYQIPNGRLVIKISRIQPPKMPFWGIGAKQISILEQRARPYFVVLLISEKEGWCFTADDVQRYIRSNKWNAARDGSYKICMQLPEANAFASAEQFLGMISARPR